MLSGFKKFVLKGNVIDLAVGIVIGASFGSLVNAFVKDILTPLIGAVVKAPDFSQLSFTINNSKFLYGDFLNVAISFLIVSSTIYFLIVLPLDKLSPKAKREAEIKKCPECFMSISIEAKRCPYCTSKIE